MLIRFCVSVFSSSSIDDYSAEQCNFTTLWLTLIPRIFRFARFIHCACNFYIDDNKRMYATLIEISIVVHCAHTNREDEHQG